MARIIFCHPSRTKYAYHIFTDLDFWDARKILMDLALVKRNFGAEPSGDEFPTQVVGTDIDRTVAATIKKRLDKAIVSPPRHVIVRSLVFDEVFEFDPGKYYPEKWSRDRMMQFTMRRLPVEQSVVSNAHQEPMLSWVGDRIRIERVQRSQRVDDVVRTVRESRRAFEVPSCF